MKYSKYFLIIALFGIVTSCSDFLDRTNPNEPDNVTDIKACTVGPGRVCGCAWGCR